MLVYSSNASIDHDVFEVSVFGECFKRRQPKYPFDTSGHNERKRYAIYRILVAGRARAHLCE